MYLIFIAMLALNMSKEVLSAFGIIKREIEGANVTAIMNNRQSPV
jgi:hypothetical protein